MGLLELLVEAAWMQKHRRGDSRAAASLNASPSIGFSLEKLCSGTLRQTGYLSTLVIAMVHRHLSWVGLFIAPPLKNVLKCMT